MFGKLSDQGPQIPWRVFNNKMQHFIFEMLFTSKSKIPLDELLPISVTKSVTHVKHPFSQVCLHTFQSPHSGERLFFFLSQKQKCTIKYKKLEG